MTPKEVVVGFCHRLATKPNGGLLPQLLESIFLIAAALFPIVNPIGSAPFFLALTRDSKQRACRLLSLRIARNFFLLLLGLLMIGSHFLSFSGVSLPIVQMGGGLVVLSSGWTMFKPDEVEHEEIRRGVAPQDVGRKAFCPLTLPLTVGPGSGSVAITLGANAPRPGRGHLAMALVAAIIGSLTMSIAMFLSNGFADRIAALLGPAARSVILRLSSFLLACIGLQIRWNGISDLLNTR